MPIPQSTDTYDKTIDTKDLIQLTGPVLVFGGPYSNLEATEAVLDDACRRYIPHGNIVCTGDLAAYCADPQAVINLVRNSGIRLVMGNCERSEEHTSELQSLRHLVCRLLLEKKKKNTSKYEVN